MLTYKEIERLHSYDIDNKVYCNRPSCHGKFGVIFKHKDIDRLLCPNCKHWVYRDEKTRLKYEMKERGVNIE